MKEMEALSHLLPVLVSQEIRLMLQVVQQLSCSPPVLSVCQPIRQVQRLSFSTAPVGTLEPLNLLKGNQVRLLMSPGLGVRYACKSWLTSRPQAADMGKYKLCPKYLAEGRVLV